MNPVTQHLISSYLLMPLLTVIFGIAAYFIARKNKLLNNRKLIVYLLLCGMILALPALCGFMDYSFMPYVYILLVVLYWTAGHYKPVHPAQGIRLGQGDAIIRHPMPADGYGHAIGSRTVLRGLQPLQRTPVWSLGLHLPAAFCIPAPVYPNGEQLF